MESVGPFEEYGDVVYARWAGREQGEFYWLRHPDHIHELLGPKAQFFEKRATDLGPILGQGLLTSEGDLWRRQRKLIQPAFKRDRTARYTEIIERQTERLIEDWKIGDVIDINREMMRVALAVVCDALFDHDIDGLSDAIEQAMATFITAGDFRKRTRAMRDLDTIIYDMIDTRKASPGEEFLSQLIDAADEEGKMSNRQLRDELMTLMLAGHETTAQGLTWAWYLLSQHPRERTRFHDEIDDGAFTRRVAQEALRLYPPAYALPRVCKNACSIGDYPIEPGAQVIAFIYWCQRDERWFEEPSAFRPDRFMDGKPPKAYLPFGAGGRSCIGKAFGMLELQGILTTIGRRFRLDLVPDQKVETDPAITLRPKYTMNMELCALTA